MTLSTHRYLCVITAYDFFAHFHPTRAFEYDFNTAYHVPSVASLALMLHWSQSARQNREQRVYLGFLVYLVVLVLVPAVDLLFAPQHEQSVYIIVLALVALSGLGNGVLQGALFAWAAEGPAEQTTALMTGQGAGSIIVLALRVVTLLLAPGEPVSSGVAFFAVGAAICVASILTFRLVVVSQPTTTPVDHAGVIALQPLVGPSAAYQSIGPSASPVVQTDALATSNETPSEAPSDASVQHAGCREERVAAECVEERVDAAGLLVGARRGVALWPGVLVCLTFAVTLALFPGVVLDLPTTSLHPPIPHVWWVVILLACFNVCDTAGRSAPSLFPAHRSLGWRVLAAASVLRLLSFPLLLVWVRAGASDLATLCAVAAFAASNGALASALMIAGPAASQDKHRAGTIMAFALHAGIVAGAVINTMISLAPR